MATARLSKAEIHRAAILATRRSLRALTISLGALTKIQYSGSMLAPYAVAGRRGDVLVGGAPSTLVTNQYDTRAFGGTVGAGLELERAPSPVPIFREVAYNADIVNLPSCCPRDIGNRAFEILPRN